MKWFIVAAMAVSFLLGGVARAQEDNFDLDALLGDVGTTAEAADEAPAPAEPAVVEEAPAAADEVAAPAEEAVAADPFAAPAEEAVAEIPAAAEAAAEPAAEDPFAGLVAEEPAAPAEEAIAEAPAAVEAAAEPAAEDPFAGLDVEEPAAPAEEAVPAFEEAVAEPAAGDDMLADLFAEPAAVEEPAPAMDAAPAADEAAAPEAAAEELSADFTAGTLDAELGAEASAPAAQAEEKLPAKEIKKIAKETAAQEEVRRQAAEANALKASETGFRALSDGDFITAENSFASSLRELPDRPQNAAVREQISWGLAEAQYLRARGMVQKNERLADARKLVDSALKAAPTHRGAQALDKRLTKLEAREALPKAPADQPATMERAKNIEQMYDEAREWYMLKDYDRASALFEKILIRDPFHKSAMRYLRKIEADKYKLATTERDARVQGMMTEVRRGWSPPIRAQIEMPADFAPGAGVDSKPASQRLQDKMQTIVIPAVEFRQANINDVVNFLVEASIAADPDKEGVNIILNLGQGGGGAPTLAPAPMPADAAAPADDWGFGGDDFGAPMAPAGGSAAGVRDITLNLRRISMIDAIKYITEVAGLKYRIEDSAVIITPIDAPVGNIITRMYPVQPSFMDVIVERESATTEERDSEFVSMGGRVSITKSDVKDFFEKTGVKFPAGASITYNATISQLIVANTADNLETFERILQQLNVVPNQVEIEARFIEVDQTDMEELGLQWILDDNYEFATKDDGSGGRLQVNANGSGLTQGNRFFGFDSGNNSVSAVSAVTQGASQSLLGNVLSASSVLTNPEVSIVLQALSQHGGTDLLSAPRVTTRSGVNAQIQVVKEIIYPTEFSVTQPSVDSEGNVTMGPISEPGTFETRETGVILNVTPTVGPDGYTIDLVMAPEVCELVEWLQYGSAIQIPGAYGTQIWTYNMPQPVFTSRNVTTSIVIWDGQTVVMGGLIREELTTIKDKVPVLGDIPVLGRLFRSEGEYSRKRNLLIFVTARLVDPAGRAIHREGNMALPGAGIDAAAEASAPVAQ